MLMLKLVISFDGCIVMVSGESWWIIGFEVCYYVYVLWFVYDVVMVGGGMVCVDCLGLNVCGFGVVC